MYIKLKTVVSNFIITFTSFLFKAVKTFSVTSSWPRSLRKFAISQAILIVLHNSWVWYNNGESAPWKKRDLRAFITDKKDGLVNHICVR